MSHIATLFTHTHPAGDCTARQAVNLSVKSWFAIATLGHAIFVGYILAVFYPPIAAQGAAGLAGLHLPSGFREGDLWGNLAAVSHVLIAVIVIGGGPLQLMPGLRIRFPRFHRMLGRSYLFAAMISATGGLFMVWTRGTVGGLVGHVAITGDGVLILIFGGMALYHALRGQIAAHRQWALRLFVAASAVWFFRVGFMGWMTLTQGAGMELVTFTGPALTVLFFGQYLLPLFMLEWYFRLQRQVGPAEQWMFTVVLAALTLYMGVGIWGATTGMWLPRI